MSFFTADTVERLVALRMQRQWNVLERKNPPSILLFCDESVLYRQADTAEVLREQLIQILEVAKLPFVTVRILPFATSMNPLAVTNNMLSLIKTSGKPGQHFDLLHIENGLFAQNVRDRYAIRQHVYILEGLKKLTLSEGESMALVAKAAYAL